MVIKEEYKVLKRSAFKYSSSPLIRQFQPKAISLIRPDLRYTEILLNYSPQESQSSYKTILIADNYSIWGFLLRFCTSDKKKMYVLMIATVYM